MDAAASLPEGLISPGYQSLLRACHAGDEHWGSTAVQWAERVRKTLERLTVDLGRLPTVLDYGAGKGTLAEALAEWPMFEYDPGIEGKDALPAPADLVVCIDVLEHVEPDCLEAVLAHLARLARREAFLAIATRKAVKELPDGQNAHLIVEDVNWWLERLAPYFDIGHTHVAGRAMFWCQAVPKSRLME